MKKILWTGTRNKKQFDHIVDTLSSVYGSDIEVIMPSNSVNCRNLDGIRDCAYREHCNVIAFDYKTPVTETFFFDVHHIDIIRHKVTKIPNGRFAVPNSEMRPHVMYDTFHSGWEKIIAVTVKYGENVVFYKEDRVEI